MKPSYSQWVSMSLAAILACTLAVRAGEVKPAIEIEPDSAAAKPGGRLEIQNEVADAGEVVRGQAANGTFVLKNVGTEPLKILNVKPGCGCTVASYDDTIAPGQTGKVTAAVKTETFRGPIEKTVTVTTDDPAKPTAVLRIKANVVGSVSLLPRPGFILPNSDLEYSGKLVVRKDETEKGDLKITDVTTSAPWVIAKVRKIETGEAFGGGIPQTVPGDWVLDVSIGEDAPRTRAPQTVRFKTGLPREPEVTVPVSAVIDAAVRAQPGRLSITTPAQPGRESSATLTAVLHPGLGNQTLQATVEPEAFEVKLEPGGSPQRYVATVTLKPGSENAPRTGMVTLKIGEETVTVPIRVVDSNAAASRAKRPPMPPPPPQAP